MTPERVARAKAEWTDARVTVDTGRPEYARFRGFRGRVVTVNWNGMALVDFGDGPWYDLPLDALHRVASSDAPAS